MKQIIVVALAFVFLTCGCGKKKPTEPPSSGIVLPRVSLMPFETGHQWDYRQQFIISSYDTLGNPTDNDTFNYRWTIKVLRADSVSPYPVKIFESIYDWNSGRDTGRVWYAQNDTVLAQTGYTYGGNVYPAGGQMVLCRGRVFANFLDLIRQIQDGVTFAAKYDTTWHPYDPPRVLLSYPLEVGKEWVHYNTAWLSHRRVLGIENVRIGIMIHRCWKIETLLDVDGNGQWDEDFKWYDWYNASGMVARSLESRGYILDPYGNIIGFGIIIQNDFLE